MKKTLAIAICSLPLALAPAVYAQGTGAPGGNTAGTGATGASPSGSSGTGATQGSATPGSMGSGSATTGTPPAASGSADTATPAAAPSTSAADQSAASGGTPADAVSGWSVKKKFMGKTVYNENDEKIGEINDIIMSDDGKVTYVVIGAGGFIGMGEHNVAIPYDKITPSNDKITLQGYTKDQLKAMPKFQTADEKAAMAPGAAPGGTGGAVTK